MNKWKMWNKWRIWKRVLKWVFPFVLIGILIAIFWPSSKAVDAIPNSITLDKEIKYSGLGATNASEITIRKAKYTSDSGAEKYIYVYCVEGGRGSIGEKTILDLDFDNENTTSDAIIIDQGIYYIAANGFLGDASGEMSDDDKINYAITQLAIWLYYYDLDTNHEDDYNDPKISKLAAAVRNEEYDTSNETYKYIVDEADKLVKGALEANSNGFENSISVGNVSTTLKVSSDDNYIESDLFTVDLINLNNYNIKVSDSVFDVVDENGNIKTSFKSGDKIKIRIPKNEVNSNLDVTVTITANGKENIPFQYVPNPHEVVLPTYSYYRQRVMAVIEPNDISKTKELNFNYSLKSGTLEIIKRDLESGIGLEGAKFRIVNSNGTFDKEVTSSSDGTINIELSYGTYTLTETSAPTGYVKSNETKTITVSNDGTVSPSSVTFTNSKVEGTVTITKVDEDGKSLSGAKLKLVDASGNVVEEWTTDINVKVIKINPGTYTLSEVSAPTGYVKSSETKTITVSNDGTVSPSSVTFTNSKVEGNVTITKIDAVTGAKLAGAKLKLVDASGNVVEEWTTDANAKAIKLNPGTYTLSEVSAPKWYIKNEMELSIVVNKDGTVNQNNIVVENVPMKKVIISKQDITNNKELSGAKLKILDSNNNVVESWTSTAEKHSLYLDAGDYKLIEESAPNGYVKSQEEIDFTVQADGSTTPGDIIMYNVPIRQISIYKKDSKSNENIVGAELQLVDIDGKIIDTWTSSTSAHTINVVPGKYILSEINPPKWYIKNYDTVEFEVYNDGTTSLENIIITNDPMKKVVISKQDITNNKELAGAELKIVDKNNKEVAKWTSTTEKHSLYLEPGDYKLIETIAPNGYVKSQEQIEFTVKSDGSTSPDEIIMYNVPLRKIAINKQDSVSKKNIAGAKLKLVDNTGKVIDTWTSSTSGHILNVVPGTYTLTELEAPEWYVKNESSIEITVHNDGTTTPSSIVMENKPVKEVVISKQDAITGKGLAGAGLKIIDENNNEVASWISTELVYSIKLKAGTYKLIETKAPNGYIKTDTEKVFTVDNEGNTNPSIIVLDNIPTSVIAISKIDSVSGERIAGAELRLLNEDGVVVDEWTSETVAKTFDLQPGKYTLEEVEAPEWYIKNDEKIEFTVDSTNNNSLNIVMDNMPFKDIIISKQDAETNKELSGAKLKIVDKNNNEVAIWTSDTAPYTLKLKPGAYKLIEVSAPEWYVREKNPIEFTVKDDGSVGNDKIIMKNKKMQEVVISKQDITTGKELPGAELKLYDANDNLIDEWISSDTPYSLKLKPGDYKLVETIAPEWYVREDEAIKFTVNEDGSTNLGKIIMKNKPMEEVVISKQDMTTSEELPGAELKLYDANDNLIEEWVSTYEPYSFKLKPGVYKLVEVTAPEWYVKSEETIEFVVNEDGTTNVDQVIMKNKPMQPVTITKKDSSSSKNLSGAKLKIKDINDNIVHGWVTEKESEMIMLKPGKYFLLEEEAPKGYAKTDEIIEFVVNADGTTDLGEIIITNKYIEVPKTAMDTQTILTIACSIFGTLGVGLVLLMKRRYDHV